MSSQPAAQPGTEESTWIDLLGAFHYVVAIIAGLFSMLPVLHLAMGIWLMTGEGMPPGDRPPPFVGGILIAFASAAILIGLSFAALIALAGSSLRRRRRYTFCLAMAGVECLFMPFGTVLGVFTIIVLLRPGVRALFQGPLTGT